MTAKRQAAGRSHRVPKRAYLHTLPLPLRSLSAANFIANESLGTMDGRAAGLVMESVRPAQRLLRRLLRLVKTTATWRHTRSPASRSRTVRGARRRALTCDLRWNTPLKCLMVAGSLMLECKFFCAKHKGHILGRCSHEASSDPLFCQETLINESHIHRLKCFI
jgi:hypothetical protein